MTMLRMKNKKPANDIARLADIVIRDETATHDAVAGNAPR